MNVFNKNKQLLGILLLFITIMGLIPVKIVAEKDVKINKSSVSKEDMFIYEDEAKEVIVDFNGDVDIVNIPSQTKIIKNSALKNKNIKKVNLNEGLIKVESDAFANNKILGSIVFPSTLKEVGDRAFADNLIQKVDFDKTAGLKLGISVFQDNKISGELDVSKIIQIPPRAFFGNDIQNIVFSSQLTFIGSEAFIGNNLTNVSISSDEALLEKDVFAGNGRFVAVYSNVVKSEKSKYHQYGHIVNPVSIKVQSVEEVEGREVLIKQEEVINFDPYDKDNFFSLNEKSFYEPDFLVGYDLDKSFHKDRLISFIPNKDYYILKVHYKKNPGPLFYLDQNKLSNLLNNKIEGSNISEGELLSFISAKDHLGNDLSSKIKVLPQNINNADPKEYKIVYSVVDYQGKIGEYNLYLPIAIDPYKIKIANSEWVLGDFIYDGSKVVGLSDSGKKKIGVIGGIAVPHMNPETFERIEEIDFKNIKRTNYSRSAGSIIFGDPNNIKRIEIEAFKDVLINGELPILPNLEYIGDSAFQNSGIEGVLKGTINLRYIGNNAFQNTSISGPLRDMFSLEYIGDNAFKETKIEGFSESLDNLKYIGDGAFGSNRLMFSLPYMPKLEYIGEGAFASSGLPGPLPDFPSLKHLGDYSFVYNKVNCPIPKMPKLVYLGNYAFFGTDMFGSLSDMLQLEYIGDKSLMLGSLFGPNPIYGQFPNIPNIKHIGDSAFAYAQFSGSLTSMPNLEELFYEAFQESSISGELPKMPKLKKVGFAAFKDSKISGELPDFPNLEVIEHSAFENTNISGKLPEMPKINTIEYRAFQKTKINDRLPEYPNLNFLGNDAFNQTNLDKAGIFYIKNNIEIEENAFRLSDDDNDKQILLTYDGGAAPNVPISNYHILNPYNIELVGVDRDNKVVFEKTRVLVQQSGDNLVVNIPQVDGYFSEERVIISKDQLVNGVYTHVYRSYKDVIDEDGGNKYQFRITPINPSDVYNNGDIINLSLCFSTTNENILRNGRIVVKYDDRIFKDFFIEEVRGIKEVDYEEGIVDIYIDKNLLEGTEISIPVNFRLKGDGLKRVGNLDAILFDAEKPLGYDEIDYGVAAIEPIYKSTFNNKDEKVLYENIVVEKLSDDYSLNVSLYPKLDNFNVDFESIRVTYQEVIYKDKNGRDQRISLANNDFYSIDNNNNIYYEVKDFDQALKIPKLELTLINPAETKEALILKSKIEIIYKDLDGKYRTVILKDTNELSIFPEERSGDILMKNIKNPHYNGRHSYFYDNVDEKKLEFKWDLFYRINRDTKELVLTDCELDERMYYKAVDPNNKKTLIVVYDKNNNILLSQNILSRYDFDEKIKHNISKIELKYYNLKEPEIIEPNIITSITDPNIEYYSEGNIDNINRFSNKMLTKQVCSKDAVYIGEDFAFTNVVKDNIDLATSVSIDADAEELSPINQTTTKFKLYSKQYFNKNIKDFNYTVLVNPGHRVDDIVFKNNLIAEYDISKTTNGFTKIDLRFVNNNTNIDIKNDKEYFELFDLKTIPISTNVRELSVYGLLHESKDEIYNIFNNGDIILENIDTSKYSFDSDRIGIKYGEYFSIQKLIVKDDQVDKEFTLKPNDEFSYRFQIDNTTNTIRENLVIVDVLPFKNDCNQSSYRNSLDLSKEIVLPNGFSIEYLNTKDDITTPNRIIIEELNNANWTSSPSEDTKAIRLKINKLNIGSSHKIDIPMITNNNLDVSYNGKININQFAYTHDTLGYKQALSNPVYTKLQIDAIKKDISLTKVSHLMGVKDGTIEDVVFGLKDLIGNLIKTEKTNKDGKLVFKDVPVGNYIIEELTSLPGYKHRAPIIQISTEDMLNEDSLFDIGEVPNNRIDEFKYFFRNVESLTNLSNLNYSELKNNYSKELVGSSFRIRNLETNISFDVNINNSFGEIITLNPGIYSVEQLSLPIDESLVYEPNSIIYMFEINKFGKIEVSSGKGDSLADKVEQTVNVIYFPNTVDFKTSTVSVFKEDKDSIRLSGAEFTLLNIDSGEELVGRTNINGEYVFNNIPPGLYSLRETKAPNGYIESGQVEIINVPVNKSEHYNYTFINNPLKINIHKYKIIASNLYSMEAAKEIASEYKSETDGNVVIQMLKNGFYEVREVWPDNIFDVNGFKFETNNLGSILDIQKTINVDKNTILDIFNGTMIPGHYEVDRFSKYVEDYVIEEGFDGTIDIDVIVKPLKGSIYVSKYLLDNNKGADDEAMAINGSEYTLYMYQNNSYEKLSSKIIENDKYVLFKDLSPLYKYKVVETFTPEGQKEANPNEYEVVLREDRGYVETVVFRNYIELKSGSVYLNKIDGRTEEALGGVEFEIIDKYGVGVKYITDSQGNILFENLMYNLAPYTIKETKAAPGYRISSQTIIVTEEDILNEKIFTVRNYKYNDVPKTGTSGKLPFFLISIPLIALAYIFKKNKH